MHHPPPAVLPSPQRANRQVQGARRPASSAFSASGRDSIGNAAGDKPDHFLLWAADFGQRDLSRGRGRRLASRGFGNLGPKQNQASGQRGRPNTGTKQLVMTRTGPTPLCRLVEGHTMLQEGILPGRAGLPSRDRPAPKAPSAQGTAMNPKRRATVRPIPTGERLAPTAEPTRNHPERKVCKHDEPKCA